MELSEVMRRIDEWEREAATRLRAWKAAGRTDEALVAIYTPEVCEKLHCDSPAEALARDRAILADAWLWEHRNDVTEGGAT